MFLIRFLLFSSLAAILSASGDSKFLRTDSSRCYLVGEWMTRVRMEATAETPQVGV